MLAFQQAFDLNKGLAIIWNSAQARPILGQIDVTQLAMIYLEMHS